MSASTLGVATRLCPACGGTLLGRAGLAWMTCTSCPLALDPFASDGLRMTTWRPREEGPADVRLPFYVFRLRRPAVAGPVWVPAFRCAGERSFDGGVGGKLTKKGYDPALGEAPLLARLARGPEEAQALLRLQLHLSAEGALDVAEMHLVSLACRLRGSSVDEPISDWQTEIDRISPRPYDSREPDRADVPGRPQPPPAPPSPKKKRR